MSKKLFAKVASAIFAVALVATSIVPALAVPESAEGVGKLKISAHFSTEEGVPVPTETLHYIVAAGTAADEDSGKIKGYAGIMDGVQLADSSISFGNTVKDGAAIVDFTGVAYTQPGVYRYVVSQTAGSIAGVTYDNNTFDVKVYVERNAEGSLEITKIISINVATGEKTFETITEEDKTNYPGKVDNIVGNDIAGAVFNNSFAAQSLIVKKTVTGNYGDTSKEFAFKINVAADDTLFVAGSEITGTITRADSTTETISIVAGTDTAFTLAHNEQLSVKGIPQGVSYTITETDVDTAVYDTSVVGTINAESAVADSYTATMGDAGDTVTFTNDKTGTTPTGVILGVAPFAAAAIAGGAYLLLKKKKDEE